VESAKVFYAVTLLAGFEYIGQCRWGPGPCLISDKYESIVPYLLSRLLLAMAYSSGSWRKLLITGKLVFLMPSETKVVGLL
jgi:hypothetical protein